ncbi:hypothetical protein [Trichocoleus sp. FACHB-262]|uniref:hypothetical protein n=1 Tax=Trichocoleus sp. FACHB-262 TaxID=2692869 RepID=UPI001682AFC3|nr:hypothetical protein [Trichocoleus sp. FACHB-262]MBD2120194.1 hypothetical protein [Trichocoleus sp. FACHB-262]
MSEVFARVTHTHDFLALQLTPCAGQLYRWLLRRKPAGRSQEFELNEFSEWTGLGRKRSYSIRHIQRSLLELAECGLVEVVRKYSGKIFKLVANHPQLDKNVAELDQNVQIGMEMSKIEASNPCSSVLSYRERIETTDKPSTHPAAVNKENQTNQRKKNQEESLAIDLLKSSDLNAKLTNSVQDAEIDTFSASGEQRETLNQVEAAIAPIPLNPQIAAVVLEATLTTVQDAIALVKERKQSGEVKNPAGLLVDAIRGQWKAAQRSTSATSEFNDWYHKAYAAGLIEYFTSSDPKVTGLPLGSIGVLRRGSEVWEDWRAIAFESQAPSNPAGKEALQIL